MPRRLNELMWVKSSGQALWHLARAAEGGPCLLCPGRFLPLPARPGLLCQPKCQHGRFLSEVPADKGRFAPGGGLSSVLFCVPHRGLPFLVGRGQLPAAGLFLLSHPAQPLLAGVSPQAPGGGASSRELFLQKGEE